MDYIMCTYLVILNLKLTTTVYDRKPWKNGERSVITITLFKSRLQFWGKETCVLFSSQANRKIIEITNKIIVKLYHYAYYTLPIFQ